MEVLIHALTWINLSVTGSLPRLTSRSQERYVARANTALWEYHEPFRGIFYQYAVSFIGTWISKYVVRYQLGNLLQNTLNKTCNITYYNDVTFCGFFECDKTAFKINIRVQNITWEKQYDLKNKQFWKLSRGALLREYSMLQINNLTWIASMSHKMYCQNAYSIIIALFHCHLIAYPILPTDSIWVITIDVNPICPEWAQLMADF